MPSTSEGDAPARAPTLRPWLPVGLSALALVWTHNYGMFLVAASPLVWLVHRPRSSRGGLRLGLTLAGALLLDLLWLPVVAAAAASSSDSRAAAIRAWLSASARCHCGSPGSAVCACMGDCKISFIAHQRVGGIVERHQRITHAIWDHSQGFLPSRIRRLARRQAIAQSACGSGPAHVATAGHPVQRVRVHA